MSRFKALLVKDDGGPLSHTIHTEFSHTLCQYRLNLPLALSTGNASAMALAH